MEYPELEETHKDHRIQLVDLHRTTQKADQVSESIDQMLIELLEAVTSSLGRWLECLTTLSVKKNILKTF